MKYPFLFFIIMLLAACNTKKKEVSIGIPLELPPTAPIPPETYCYLQKNADGSNLARMVLTITGDSVFGKINFEKNAANPGASMVGLIYDSTIEAGYTYKCDTGWRTELQQWKLTPDSIYRIVKNPKRYSGTDSSLNSNTIPMPGAMAKIPCK